MADPSPWPCSPPPPSSEAGGRRRCKRTLGTAAVRRAALVSPARRRAAAYNSPPKGARLRRLVAVAAVIVVLGLASCKSAQDLMAEGDGFRAQRQYDDATARYEQARQKSESDTTLVERIDRTLGEIRFEK